jgi:flagellar protein FlbD
LCRAVDPYLFAAHADADRQVIGGVEAMIEVTRLNGHPIVVNCDLIKFVEAIPDTTLTLASGERLIVRESCSQLVTLIAGWRVHVLRCAWPSRDEALGETINPTRGVVELPAAPDEDER